MNIKARPEQEPLHDEEKAVNAAKSALPNPSDRPDELHRRMQAHKVTKGENMTEQALISLCYYHGLDPAQYGLDPVHPHPADMDDVTLERHWSPYDPPPLDKAINRDQEDVPTASRDLELWPGMLYQLACATCGDVFEERANDQGRLWITNCEEHRGNQWVPADDRPLSNPDEADPPVASQDLELEPWTTHRLRCKTCGKIYEEPIAKSGAPFRVNCEEHLDEDARREYLDKLACPLCQVDTELPEDHRPETGRNLCDDCLSEHAGDAE